MIKLEEISRGMYISLGQEISKEKLKFPKDKPSIKYYKVIRNDEFVGVRCGRILGVVIYSEQFIIHKDFKGQARYIISDIINTFLDDYKAYTAVWTKKIFDIMKGSFDIKTVSSRGNSESKRISINSKKKGGF